MSSGFICWFDGAESRDPSLVGGKAANLGLLASGGFNVPVGFSVTTAAYSELLLGVSGLTEEIGRCLSTVNYEDTESVDAAASVIRSRILGAPMPEAIAKSIADAYGKLGPDPHVAVRSSAIGEDMAEASFAGLHDTYLDVSGADQVIEAVQSCWASVWNTRAIVYRKRNGIDPADAQIAVVVQLMVAPDVSGVMFTCNPLTTATDEIVIDASWGLGEVIVQGSIVPDQYIVKVVDGFLGGPQLGPDDRRPLSEPRRMPALKIRDRTLGSKEMRIVRHPGGGVGTVEQPVPEADRARFTLSDGQVKRLAELGRRITAFYGRFPQDVEWALADGKFYVLQSRPITGVEYSWDVDLESWQTLPDDDEIIWSRAVADQWWTGGSTPLFYSFRAFIIEKAWTDIGHKFGIPEVARPTQRVMKFHKGCAYVNPAIDKLMLEHTWLPVVREEGSLALQFQPPAWHDEILKKPFSYLSFLRMQLHRREVAPTNGPYGAFKMMHDFCTTDEWSLERLPDPRSLDDDELEECLEKWLYHELWYNQEAGLPMLIWWGNSAFVGFKRLIDAWYDGDNKMAFGDLVMGATRRTRTVEENLALVELTEMVRNSPELDALFVAHEGTAFFDELRNGSGGEAGRAFLAKYDEFIRVHGHRGSEDRDIYYPRRAEDPSIDYRSIRTLMSLGADGVTDPEAKERAVNARRGAAFEDVVQNLRRQRFGFVKAEIFKLLFEYNHRWIAFRDDERWSYERYVLAFKLLFREMGRRLVERNVLETEDDMYFLGKDELYELFDGYGDLKLARAKIAARRRDHHRVCTRERIPPMYMKGDTPLPDDALSHVSLSLDAATNGGRLRATPISPGTVTATARVVRRLEETKRVQPGEIMVCNATDPGWTPVFLIMSGIVTETGGIMAHAASLAREYGLPAVQMAKAMQIIPDGATISIDGFTGEVTIVEHPVPDAATSVNVDAEVATATTESRLDELLPQP